MELKQITEKMVRDMCLSFSCIMQVKNMKEEYNQLNRVKLSIWEHCELLTPDMDEYQIEHLSQTTKAIRMAIRINIWLDLTGLIHGT